jgi:hypothetical protein
MPAILRHIRQELPVMVIFRNWHLEICKHGQVEEGKSAITFVTTLVTSSRLLFRLTTML